MSETVEANPISDMIQHALDQDFNKANDVFNNMMTVKMSDLLDQEKIKLADQIYNGAEPEDEDEEQLELELDDDEISDEFAEDDDIEEIGSEIDDETEVGSEEEEE
jgi:hypothetical protein